MIQDTHAFTYVDRQLLCEQVPVADIAAAVGTPVWIYSRRALLERLEEIRHHFAAVSPLICYSVKTNGNLALCRLLHAAGAGFDVTSGGELYRAVRAGASGHEIVFAGVGKTDQELRQGLDADVLLFNVESEAELEALADLARSKGQPARIALRVNPDVDPQTHAKTTTGKRGSKFGLDWAKTTDLATRLRDHPWLHVRGLHMHLGSPIYSVDPYARAIERIVPLIETMRRMGHALDYLDAGGGFGIPYRRNETLSLAALAQAIVPAVQTLQCKLILEPGRYIAGNAGILVSRVIYVKESGGRRFVIQDAAMNDLIRPTLYEAFHRIWPVQVPADAPVWPEDPEAAHAGTVLCDVVGPVCESGDYLARDRYLPPVRRGDLLATFSAGAYGMAMSSNYNGRCRAAEVLVEGNSFRTIRRRETYADLVRLEE
ncbi:MAG: diaminopimelate decarboxylase [Gemmataceae bacterium]|mgnify:CR=1 FL=1